MYYSIPRPFETTSASINMLSTNPATSKDVVYAAASIVIYPFQGGIGVKTAERYLANFLFKIAVC